MLNLRFLILDLKKTHLGNLIFVLIRIVVPIIDPQRYLQTYISRTEKNGKNRELWTPRQGRTQPFPLWVKESGDKGLPRERQQEHRSIQRNLRAEQEPRNP